MKATLIISTLILVTTTFAEEYSYPKECDLLHFNGYRIVELSIYENNTKGMLLLRQRDGKTQEVYYSSVKYSENTFSLSSPTKHDETLSRFHSITLTITSGRNILRLKDGTKVELRDKQAPKSRIIDVGDVFPG